MTSIVGILLIVLGMLPVAAPASVGRCLRYLNRLAAVPDYWYYDPERIRSSFWLRLGYRLNGLGILAMALYWLFLFQAISLQSGRAMAVAEKVTVFAGPLVLLWFGIRTLGDPSWFDKWVAHGELSTGRAYLFRRRVIRMIGALCFAISVFLLWTVIVR